jgi:hypothetical protein
VRQDRIERGLNRLRQLLEPRLPLVPWSGTEWHFKRRLPYARKPTGVMVSRHKPVDFLRGPSEMADAIRQRRACRLSADCGLHIVEIVEALQYPERFGGRRKIESAFDPISPLPWNA